MLELVLLIEGNAPSPAAAAGQEALLQQLAQGDREALAAFYAQTRSAVYGFALSILKNPQKAEDVMQDTYIRIVQAAESYSPQGKPMAWVFTIVRRLALMKLREDAKAPLPLEEWLPAPEDSPAQASIERMALRAAFSILSDEERQIVMLHALTGMKHRELAETLQAPLSTVLSKYRRALNKLKNYLKEEAIV